MKEIPTASPPGAYDDLTHSGRRLKPRGKRKKPFIIESRLARRVSDNFARRLGIYDWHIHSRYVTQAQRDQAYAVLVKKAKHGWWAGRWEYRKGPVPTSRRSPARRS